MSKNTVCALFKDTYSNRPNSTLVFLVAMPLNRSEAGGDHGVIITKINDS